MSSPKVDKSMIHGEVAPGFQAVREEFEKNFAERGELGAACCAYQDGKKVVDLWGGYGDHEKLLPWEEDTLILVFSTTKGLAAMTLPVAHSRGWLDFDEKVATYWPEFAQEGKGNITVRQLLSHQAGLPVIDEPLTPEVLADLDAVAAILAKQKPAWKPGTKHGYHTISLGFYEGELLRRVDPQHRSLGRFFQEEIAAPLGIEFYIGTPRGIPDSRIARMLDVSPIKILLHAGDSGARFALAIMNPWSPTSKSFFNPKVKLGSDFGRPPLRYVEVPASNGIGQVRAIAKAYSVFATGGGELNMKEETLQALTEAATCPTCGFFDEILKDEIHYSLGYWKPYPGFSFGSSDKAFGTPGLGGSFGFADPDAGIGYAYAMTRMGYKLPDEPREKAVRDALYRCLGYFET